MSAFKSLFSFIGLTDDKYVIVKEAPKNSKDGFTMPLPKDNVNHPKHYTQGGIECIVLPWAKQALKLFALPTLSNIYGVMKKKRRRRLPKSKVVS